MAMIVLLLCLFTVTSSAGVLEQALKSPKLMLNLFNDYKTMQGVNYSPLEAPMRFRLFRKDVAEVARLNAAQSDYVAEINFMSDLTDVEKQAWYGLNMTDNGEQGLSRSNTPVDPVIADDVKELDWYSKNKVGPVKNQKGCGSCWSFGGTGALESRYAMATGALKLFAEQQGLDCAYEDRKYRDGCKGGWMRDVWIYIMKSGHYSLMEDYPYEAKDLKCRTYGKRNAITHAAVESYNMVDVGDGNTDDNLVYALRSGAVAVAFKVQSGFSHYKKGIYKDNNCPKRSPSHAVLAVGYGPDYIKVKNSWGTTWGDKGFIKFARIGNMCGLSGFASYPVMRKIADEDDPKCSDAHRECSQWKEHCGTGEHWKYMADNCRKTCDMCSCGMDGCKLCFDILPGCAAWSKDGYCKRPWYKYFMKNYCPDSCGYCGQDDGDDDTDDGDGKCSNGLKWCHGECRHEHFC